MNVYIASSEKHVGNIQEDMYIRDAFASKGISSEILTLKEIVEISKPSDAVILKSIWGYHLDYKDFLGHISALKRKDVRLINDYDFIVWNIHKYRYMDEIKHLDVVPTNLLQISRTRTASEIVGLISDAGKALNADKLVIKPAISASGYLTYAYDTNQDNSEVVALLKTHKHLDFIVQPYRPSIIEGEVSAVLVGGKLLYGVTRFPGVLGQKGDTSYLGLTSMPDSAKKGLAGLENFFLGKFGVLPGICRVDFLKNRSSYEILEVELIDPDLFFRRIPKNVREEALSAFCELLTTEGFMLQ